MALTLSPVWGLCASFSWSGSGRQRFGVTGSLQGMSPDVNAGETPQVTSRRGSLVAGRYRIDSLIAAGGMGEV